MKKSDTPKNEPTKGSGSDAPTGSARFKVMVHRDAFIHDAKNGKAIVSCPRSATAIALAEVMNEKEKSGEFEAWTTWAEHVAKIRGRALAAFYRRNRDYTGAACDLTVAAQKHADSVAAADPESIRLKAIWQNV